MPDPTATAAPADETGGTPEAAQPEPSPAKDTPKRGRPPADAKRIDKLEEKVDTIGQSLATITALLTAQAAAQAETATPAEPTEPAELELAPWGADGTYLYSSPHRSLMLIRVPGEKMIVNGQVVVTHQQAADFIEGQYTAPDEDWRDWIESHQMFKTGAIVRGATLRAKPQAVHTGPKTSLQPDRQAKTVARPHGALSATI